MLTLFPFVVTLCCAIHLSTVNRLTELSIVGSHGLSQQSQFSIDMSGRSTESRDENNKNVVTACCWLVR